MVADNQCQPLFGSIDFTKYQENLPTGTKVIVGKATFPQTPTAMTALYLNTTAIFAVVLFNDGFPTSINFLIVSRI